jgi:hypothetical protein
MLAFFCIVVYNPEFDSHREAESQKSLENSRFFGSL